MIKRKESAGNDTSLPTSIPKVPQLIHDEKEVGRYGWGHYCPDSLQRLNSPKWATAFFCLASLVQGVVINGLLHYFLPMIERRFGLTSTESGTMSGAYDLGAMLCVIPATYLGGRRGSHRPRYVGCGMLVMGTGSLIFSLPAFFGGVYRRAAKKDLCDPAAPLPNEDLDEDSAVYFWVLFIGNFLHGIGASPLYTLAVTYIDDNVPVDQASIYLGFYYMMAVIGPFLGMVGGGMFSHVNGDIMLQKADTKGELTPDSPAWVGCWWCGFMVSGIFAFIFSLPILGLPKQLADAKAHLLEREHLQDGDKKRMAFTSFSQLLPAVLEVLKSAKFDFITAGGCAEALIFSGMSAFLAKLLHLQFGLGQFEIALYMCIITVPSTLAGIYFGSSIIKLCRMGVKEILAMNVILLLFCIPCASGVFISCPGQGVAGVNIAYVNRTNGTFSDVISVDWRLIGSLEAECNKDCRCDERVYSPVCGADGIEYYSACYAGCRSVDNTRRIKVYWDCSCVRSPAAGKVEAVGGSCTVPCPLFPLFVFLIFVYLFLSFSALIPSITATLRVVHTDQGSLALGVQWLFARALGTVPGPILFGKAIDLACSRWLPTRRGDTANCILYNHLSLSRNLGLMIEAFKLLAEVCFGVALYLAHSDSKRQQPDHESTNIK